MIEVLFINILRLSFKATLVSLIIILIRYAFRKYPKRYICYLWLLLFIYLIIPITFSNKYSLMNVFDNNDDTSNLVINSIKLADGIVNSSDKLLNTATNKQHMFMLIGSAIWLIGMILISSYLCVKQYKLHRKLKFVKSYKDNTYYISNNCAPFVYGIIRPLIYIPYGLSDNQMEIVIAHEKTHIIRKDNLIKLISIVLNIIHWFNPIIWLSFYLMNEDREMACDEETLQNTSIKPKEYCSTLLELSYSASYLTNNFSAINSRKLKTRLNNMLNSKKNKKIVFVIIIFVVLIVVSFFVSDPLKKSHFFGQVNETTTYDTLNNYYYPINGEITISADYDTYEHHNGIDLLKNYEKQFDVYPAAKGDVLDVGTDSNGYKYVMIKHPDGYISYYADLSSTNVNKGDNVELLDKIGEVNIENRALNKHLHFSLMDNENKLISNIDELLLKR